MFFVGYTINQGLTIVEHINVKSQPRSNWRQSVYEERTTKSLYFFIDQSKSSCSENKSHIFK